jgi:large subunit ribosomal protein L24
MHIKTNDTVEVIAGDDKGVRGKVLRIDRDGGKIVVEGVAKVYKHVRRSQKNPQGGRLHKESAIQLSNVLLLCPKCGKGVRTGSKVQADGSKDRVCKKCGDSLGRISPPKAKKV